MDLSNFRSCCNNEGEANGCLSNKGEANGGEKLFVICDDLLVEILCCLPQKPLVRFKCLSKSWCHLISTICIPRQSLSPAACSVPVAGLYFRTYELNHSAPFIERFRKDPLCQHYLNDEVPEDYLQTFKSGFYVGVDQVEDNCGTDDVGRKLVELGEYFGNCGLPFVPLHDDFLDCCNGLLLFVNSPLSQYYVCNPITKECISIPTACRHKDHCMYAALAFDPSKSPTYKVVRFEHFQTADVGLDIYYSETGRWIKYSLKLRPYETYSMFTRYSVYFDGALFRLCSSLHLVRFDLEEVNACVIRLPIAKHECEALLGCFGVLMNNLCYANEEIQSSYMVIWSLESSKSRKWILMYKIYIPHLTWKLKLQKPPIHPDASWVGPCAFHPSSNVIFINTQEMIWSYDMNSRRLKELVKIKDGLAILPGCYYPALTYMRFLVPFSELGKFCQASMNYGATPGSDIKNM